MREDVWNFHIGGYQVCEKWLKDRKGRTLSKDDIAHYQKIVVALTETIRLMRRSTKSSRARRLARRVCCKVRRHTDGRVGTAFAVDTEVSEWTRIPNNVVAAFEMLLEEVEAEIDFTSAIGAEAFEKRDFDSAREALEYAGKVTAFRDRIAGMRDEWEAGYTATPEEQEERQRERREYLGRLQRGVRTPEREYFRPILQTLVAMGGSARWPMSSLVSSR